MNGDINFHKIVIQKGLFLELFICSFSFSLFARIPEIPAVRHILRSLEISRELLARFVFHPTTRHNASGKRTEYYLNPSVSSALSDNSDDASS